MAESEKPKGGPPESPTTARELDFDDDDVPASPKLSKSGGTADTSPAAIKTGAPAENAPQQPPRPLSPQAQAEATLKEAFPSIDAAVIKAVLVASGGQVEPAFNALLGMTDPDSQREPAPPPQPPRPVRGAAPRNQVEADALYARQLAEHYNNQDARRDSSRDYRGQDNPRVPRQRKETGLKPNEMYDDTERSFIDDDLPIIKESIRKGFLETQSTVTGFLTKLKKRIDGEDDEDEQPPPPPPRRPGQQQYSRGGEGRRSSDRDRYDADPQVLGDDFSALNLRDETVASQRRNRPGDPDLFKPTPNVPSERKVSFQEGPPEQIDELYRTSPDPTKRPTSTGGRGKWQPLAAADPTPVGDHDPFSVGDSDDDQDAKKKDTGIKMEDAERLKQATAEAMADTIGSDAKKGDETKASGDAKDRIGDKVTGK